MRSLLRITAITALIVLSTLCTALAQYTAPSEVIIKLVEDAYKNRVKDSIISTMQAARVRDSVDRAQLYADFTTKVLNAENENKNLQRQILIHEDIQGGAFDEVGIWKANARRYKRQRNGLIAGVAVIATASIIATVKNQFK